MGLDPDPALLAEVVQEETGPAHPLDVLLVSVEDGDAPHTSGHFAAVTPPMAPAPMTRMLASTTVSPG